MDNKHHINGNRVVFLEEALKATFNILEDFAEEKSRLEELQKVTINILDDFNQEKIKVQLSNEELKNEINERAKIEMQLRSVNKELEAFSYSVSHDLRAPLRAVHGFANILFELYYNKFDDDGKELLADILKNAESMGQLIDDILKFSKLSRKEINKVEINMSNLAQSVLNDIVFQEKTKNIKCTISQIPTAFADYSLLKQVFVNLISNAIKFSSLNDDPIIEIDARVEGNENIYWIKDNGVGFDMKYVNKLFGVFQRLHGYNEFEGTGVGLAIVNRIIEKHGGRVWAEGEINKGAAFYFALPVNPDNN